MGIGRKLRSSSGQASENVSHGGATNKAPATLAASWSAAQCAVATQPRLWATRMIGGTALRTAPSIKPVQSSREGRHHSRCSTRRKLTLAASQMDCQCAGPDPFQPGMVRIVPFLIILLSIDFIIIKY